MRLASGSVSWILSSLFLGGFFFILSVFFNDGRIRSVLFFISFVLFCLTILFLVFFRDPDRIVGSGVVACADGRIREITELNDADVGRCVMVSTFMNLYNVHVNRMPIAGEIIDVKHYSGWHLPAFRKESEKNERLILVVDSGIGRVKIVQIAGIIARRIVPYVKKGDKIGKGDRIGIIRFGSRVDVYLPEDKIKKVNVKVGDFVKAGVDTIAEIND